jgi:1-acyl-sn-glycerol-3-phosphate acyltransferase
MGILPRTWKQSQHSIRRVVNRWQVIFPEGRRRRNDRIRFGIDSTNSAWDDRNDVQLSPSTGLKA